MFNSILVLCMGNICRSPIAERLLRRSLPHLNVDSAGVGAMINEPADPSAIYVAELHELSLQGHLSRQFTSLMGRRYDLILVMEKSHIEKVSLISPEARGKTMLLGHWLEQREIPDPYRKSNEAFESVYQLIDKACKTWVEKL